MGASDKKTMKKAWNHEIDEKLVEEFNELASLLTAPKYKIIEAMIRAFQALPEDLQVKLMSARPETREPALRLLASLAASQLQAQSDRPTKRAKSV